jgi:hypothetical protein
VLLGAAAVAGVMGVTGAVLEAEADGADVAVVGEDALVFVPPPLQETATTARRAIVGASRTHMSRNLRTAGFTDGAEKVCARQNLVCRAIARRRLGR